MLRKITNFKIRGIQIIMPEPIYIDVNEDGTVAGTEGYGLALAAEALAQMAEALREKNLPNDGTEKGDDYVETEV